MTLSVCEPRGGGGGAPSKNILRGGQIWGAWEDFKALEWGGAPGGGGATQQSFIRGGSAPRSNPFGTLFYSLFDTPS